LAIINFSINAQIKISENQNNYKPRANVEQIQALKQLKKNIEGVQLAWNENNPTPTFLIGKLTADGYVKRFSTAESAAKSFLNENKILFNIKSPDEEFALLKSKVDNMEMTHVKLQQYYEGLRII